MMRDDLSEAINRVSLAQIINDFTPTPETARLGEHGGVIRDPRPGHGEHSPSFSVFQHDGRDLYKRHGGDGATGNAFQYLVHELGMSPADAALEIKRRAGLETTLSSTRSRVNAVNYTPIGEASISKLEASRALLEQRWPVQALEARGFTLSGAQACGLALAANGDTIIPITDASGRVVSLKRRAAVQDAKPRYSYLEGGTGTPAWCSPGYGTAQAVLIVEGELNGMVAHLALEGAGIALDVQSIAGTSGKPHAGVLEGRNVLIYADGDEPGLKARDGWVQLAHEAGAASVRVLESLADLKDFCDVAGTDGLGALGAVLQERIRDAVTVEAEQGEEWPEPEPFTTDLAPVPSLDPELLPEPLRAYCADISYRLNVPLEFAAVPLLSVMGALIGRSVGLRPKLHDDWTIFPNLFAAIIAPPSIGKTPVLNEVLRPVRALAKAAFDAADTAGLESNTDREMIELALSSLKSRIKGANKKLNSAATPEQRAELKELQVQLARAGDVKPKRYEVNDCTDAKLAELLSENPRGLLLTRDELTGFLEQLDKEHFSRTLYLELWNGNAHHTVDRKDGGTVRLEGAALGMIGGIQPSRLKRYVADSFGLGSSDGFLARFLMVWPDNFGTFTFTDQYPNSDARKAVNALFKALDEADFPKFGAKVIPDSDEPPYFRLEPEAYEVFKDFLTTAMQRMRRDGFGDAADEFTGKLGKVFGSIALILHLTMVVHEGLSAGQVGERAALMAAAWCDFLEAHWRKVLSLAKQASPAAMLAERIKRGDVHDGMTVRDLARKQWAGLSSETRIQEALDEFTGLDWIRIESLETGGRAARVVRVNPGLTTKDGGGDE